jgi:OFA family oxalate/formate antiporter-like MFS transporter
MIMRLTLGSRWVQLAIGVFMMMTISSPQFVWTFFAKPFQQATNSSLAAVQVTFTLLIVLQTFFAPFQGFLVERTSPRLMISVGAVLNGLGWLVASQAHSLFSLYAGYGVLCGLGTGIVYIGVIGLTVRWFPDLRGFAVGLVAAGYGIGAMLTTFPISNMIAAEGFRPTLRTFGLILAALGVAAATMLRNPEASEVAGHSSAISDIRAKDVAPREMLRTPLFWLMFTMMAMTATGGLMVTAQFAAFAREFGVADAMVFGFALVPFALTFDRITNGLTRPFFGFVSDRIGRENCMALAFTLEAFAVCLLLVYRQNPYAFAILSGVVFFAWGEIFSLFPAMLTDTFGAKHATTNYGFLYIAQGVGSLLGGPVAVLLHDLAGDWIPVFWVAIALDLVTAGLALIVLKPARQTWLSSSTFYDTSKRLQVHTAS